MTGKASSSGMLFSQGQWLRVALYMVMSDTASTMLLVIMTIITGNLIQHMGSIWRRFLISGAGENV